jgi:tRNA pseudouridine55 synthase
MILTKDADLSQVDFLAGATLLIDKPLTWTSFDVVNKVRYSLKKYLDIKKIKVGHAGTLDPLADGLLILCTGKHTKTIESLQGKNKTYEGKMIIGATTPSYDRETEVDKEYPTEHIDANMLEEKRQEFIGQIDQFPPIFSAIKKNGKALYKYARKGQEVEINSRPVTIHSFDLMSKELPELEFSVECSKGTYIRSLAFDYGKALGSGGYLSALTRTKIEEFELKDAWNLEQFISAIGDITVTH